MGDVSCLWVTYAAEGAGTSAVRGSLFNKGPLSVRIMKKLWSKISIKRIENEAEKRELHELLATR